ncbi:hypothetical protein LX32DRAFT_296015 [Colletotrichum zoysiae]|uniref:Uncharacterized protein n=1 Tax=Colletotrichum zoysiae TaxID=1216348 RepID=A0AAD9HNE8_9PEZI|nr:hypothetical protein LX32DRAFT_296015 [Colletotrichum zoysiae]
MRRFDASSAAIPHPPHPTPPGGVSYLTRYDAATCEGREGMRWASGEPRCAMLCCFVCFFTQLPWLSPAIFPYNSSFNGLPQLGMNFGFEFPVSRTMGFHSDPLRNLLRVSGPPVTRLQ